MLNRLHGLPRDLVPGGAPTDLTAAKAAAQQRGLRPVTATGSTLTQIHAWCGGGRQAAGLRL